MVSGVVSVFLSSLLSPSLDLALQYTLTVLNLLHHEIVQLSPYSLVS